MITGFGCFALSDDTSTLEITAWGRATRKFEAEDGSIVGQITYIGLRKFVVRTCTEAEGSDFGSWRRCESEDTWWMGAKCAPGEEAYYGFRCQDVETCRESSVNSQFGAFTTAVTLLFAMMGCLTRIRKVWERLCHCKSCAWLLDLVYMFVFFFRSRTRTSKSL